MRSASAVIARNKEKRYKISTRSVYQEWRRSKKIAVSNATFRTNDNVGWYLKVPSCISAPQKVLV